MLEIGEKIQKINLDSDNEATNHNNVGQEQEKQKEQQPSEDIKPHEIGNIRYGKCKWFNVAKGWGFITPHDGGREVFVHQSVIQMSGFRSLGEQEEVEFECKLSERGLEATRVSGKEGTECHGSGKPRTRNRRRYRRIRCYNCGNFANHIAIKCNLGPQPKSCHLCKSVCHLFANCPTKKKESFSGAKNQPKKSIESAKSLEECKEVTEEKDNK
uniref:CSD domain-containing protein n=1 Tax=Glossina brevipalpis TaxID=37001 RepID=A0A1A9W4U5_9MUSC